jgi:hypothetical protein
MSYFKMTGEKGGNQNIRWSVRDRIVDAGSEIESLNRSLANSKNKTEAEQELYASTSDYLKKLKQLHKA